MNKTTFAEKVATLLGKPYKLGKLDCYHLLRHFFPQLPTEWNGLSDETCRQYSLDELSDILLEIIKKYCIEIDKTQRRVGDIVVLENDIVGIYTGNDTFLTVFVDRGVHVLPIFADYFVFRVK